MDATNWVSSFASVIAAIGVILVWVQIDLARQIMIKDHERSRRENTINVMQQWYRDIKPESSAADKVVRNLSENECRELVNNNTIAVSINYKGLLESCIGKECCNNETENFIELSTEEANLLRFHTMTYLNATETMLTAWHINVVDRETIENQFKYLYRPKEGYDTLKNFRIAAGGLDAFPSIEAFLEKLEENMKSGAPRAKSAIT